jgi:hypothetical protein
MQYPTLASIMLVLVLASGCSSGSSEDGTTTRDPIEESACKLYSDVGSPPQDWFDAEGALTVTRDEIAGVAIALGAQGRLDDSNKVSLTVSRMISDRLSGEAIPLTTDEKRALATFEARVERSCG